MPVVTFHTYAQAEDLPPWVRRERERELQVGVL
jgi:hypothetical protein